MEAAEKSVQSEILAVLQIIHNLNYRGTECTTNCAQDSILVRTMRKLAAIPIRTPAWCVDLIAHPRFSISKHVPIRLLTCHTSASACLFHAHSSVCISQRSKGRPFVVSHLHIAMKTMKVLSAMPLRIFMQGCHTAQSLVVPVCVLYFMCENSCKSMPQRLTFQLRGSGCLADYQYNRENDAGT